jgi:hypothetical protein
VLVRVKRPNVAEQPPGSGFVPEMLPRRGDITVVKRTIGAFYGTGLAGQLRVCRGNGGHGWNRYDDGGRVDSPCGIGSRIRGGFASDAMSGMTPQEHEHALLDR